MSSEPKDPGESGSVEVELSSSASDHASVPVPVAAVDSEPVASGPVKATAATEPTGPHRSARTKRITSAIQDTVSGGVEALGSGIGTLGEGVSKIGDVTNKVPLLGASIVALGEGITKAGESVHALPRVAKTRRGRLLVRSVVVGFLLVFAWIAAIVGYQVSRNDTPDFRPEAERILVEISKGPDAIGDVYEKASPRFQEMVRKERFLDDMTDMNATVGKFREITAINQTLLSNGPTGKVGRVSLTASYDRGVCKGSISFHYDKGEWKLLGIGIELPPELTVTQAQREQRVKACKDPDDRRSCDVRDAAETVLEQLRDGKAGAVWDASSDMFKKQESRMQFLAVQAEHQIALGAYKRILTVTEAKLFGGGSKLQSATFDALAEFEKSSGVRVVFGFERDAKNAPWQLRSMKVVVPMPRAEESGTPAPDIVPIPDAGVPPAPPPKSRGR